MARVQLRAAGPRKATPVPSMKLHIISEDDSGELKHKAISCTQARIQKEIQQVYFSLSKPFRELQIERQRTKNRKERTPLV